jgi:hypothetical protein
MSISTFTIKLHNNRYHVERNGWPVGSVIGYATEWHALNVIKQMKRLAALS